MRQVVGLGAVAGQAKSRQSELLGRNARRVWPSVVAQGRKEKSKPAALEPKAAAPAVQSREKPKM